MRRLVGGSHQDRVLERLRSAAADGQPVLTARQIAADINSSRNYVAQTLDQLAQSALVRADREPGPDGNQWHLTPVTGGER
jgi:DNA-binding IscR family transcriptional regulator